MASISVLSNWWVHFEWICIYIHKKKINRKKKEKKTLFVEVIDPAACSITSALSMTTATPASAPLAPGRGAMPSTPVYPRLSPSTKESTPLSRHKTRYSPFKLLPTSLASRRQLKTICPKLYFQKIVKISTKKKKTQLPVSI